MCYNELLANKHTQVGPMAMAGVISILYISLGRTQREQCACTDCVLQSGMIPLRVQTTESLVYSGLLQAHKWTHVVSVAMTEVIGILYITVGRTQGEQCAFMDCSSLT